MSFRIFIEIDIEFQLTGERAMGKGLSAGETPQAKVCKIFRLRRSGAYRLNLQDFQVEIV